VRGKILVIRGGAIGDFILTLPALAALRQQFPDAFLEVLGYPHIVQLALTAGLVDCARSIDARPLATFFARNGALAEEMRDYFSEFDVIVSYLYDPDDIFRTNVGRCSPAQFIAGPHRPDETPAVHAAELLLRPLQALDIRGADPRPRLPLPATPPAPPRLALHPGSGSERKNWPEAKWAELLKLLAGQSACDLLLIGGEAEGDRCARLASTLPAGRAHIAQNPPLIELARRMQACSAFIGHDSGITHLAAALDLPGLVLWGETDLTTWRPQSARLKILRDPAGLEALPVATVWDSIQLFGWRFPALNPNLIPNEDQD